MNITGSFYYRSQGATADTCTVSGAFTRATDNNGGPTWENTGNNGDTKIRAVTFTASRNWTGSTSSNGSHSHTLTVTKNANIYGNSSTVQPNALKIRVKCKAK